MHTEKLPKPHLRDHVIVVGLGRIGISVLELLNAQGETTVLVTTNVRPEWSEKVHRLAADLVVGDGRNEQTLLQAGIETARSIIITTDDDLTNLEIALDACRAAPDVAVVVRMQDHKLAKRVRQDLPLRAVLEPSELSAPAFVAAALGSELLRAFEVEGCSVNILAVPIDEKLGDGRLTIRSLAARLDMIPLALRSGDDGEHTLSPSIDEPLTPGDEVVFAASHSALHALQHMDDIAAGLVHHHDHGHDPKHPHPRQKRPRAVWARPSTGMRDILAAVWKQSPTAFRIVMLALPSIFLISTLVFRYGMSLGWADALYFTVTIITTIGFGDINFLHAPLWIKLFGCLLMVSGASSLVLLYSLITDYIVTRRVEALVEPPVSVLADHVVVVGMGGIGRRVVIRLHQMGEPVLAVEKDPEIVSARRLPPEVPVLIGDANRRSTLERANAGKARAVVAVTDNDLVNLRVAQTAESMNQDTRTVVRLFRTSLAGKLGTSIIGVDQPLNPFDAAAATFAASALAEGVEQGFTLGGRLLMLRSVEAGDIPGAVGKTVAALRDERDRLIILRRPAGAEGMQDARAEDVIQPDDRLVVLEEYETAEHATGTCRLMSLPRGSIFVNQTELAREG